jgi:hypothetical protein
MKSNWSLALIFSAVQFFAAGAYGQVDSTGVTPLRGTPLLPAAAVPSQGQGLGYGQTWDTTYRAANTWHHNDTGKPIMVFCAHIRGAGVWYVGPSPTNYVSFQYDDLDSDLDNPSVILVPVNHWYNRSRSCDHGYRELR